MRKKRWEVAPSPTDTKAIEYLMQEWNLPRTVAEIAVARGITDAAKAARFFRAGLRDRHAASLLGGAERAVERIRRAVHDGERIVVYGDYDVDGITSTSVMLRCLRALGGNADYYIPDRLEEGYGLQEEALQHICETGCTLVITVDCGIASVALAKQFGERLDLIITDHHQPGEVLPPAYAVINPKQPGCLYPDKNLAGVGVAYTLCRLLWQAERGEDYTADVELVALGTVADVVPLTDDNRIYVREGLRRMATTENVGLKALLEVAQIPAAAVTSERIGFGLAPRLNAAGRMAHARLGVELLTATDAAAATALAERLGEINATRQQEERELLQAAQARLRELGAEEDRMPVIDGTGWHGGVIGIVASRFVDMLARPTVMISVTDGIGKGSCRSIPALNMYDALRYCEDLLLQFGGHHQAAGFSVAAENIPALRQRLQEYVALHLQPEDFIPQLDITAELRLSEVSVEFVEALAKLEPFGEANPSPLFVTYDAQVRDIRRIGKDRRHLKAYVRQDGYELDWVGWGMGDRTRDVFGGDRISFVYALQENEWQQVRNVQGVVRDIHVEETEPQPITRDEVAAVYRFVHGYLRQGPQSVALTEAALAEYRGWPYTARTALTGLCILKELGLVAEETEEDELKYRLVPAETKLDLASAPTYRRCNSREDER